MKIISWNVNSVHTELKIFFTIKFETRHFVIARNKTQNENFPSEIFKKKMDIIHIWSSYNGVAFLSKPKIENQKEVLNDKLKQSRVIQKYFKKKTKLINIYVPNGNPVDTDKYEYKNWLTSLIKNYN